MAVGADWVALLPAKIELTQIHQPLRIRLAAPAAARWELADSIVRLLDGHAASERRPDEHLLLQYVALVKELVGAACVDDVVEPRLEQIRLIRREPLCREEQARLGAVGAWDEGTRMIGDAKPLPPSAAPSAPRTMAGAPPSSAHSLARRTMQSDPSHSRRGASGKARCEGGG
eukprot:7391972-Prymnesium_polylepis.2